MCIFPHDKQEQMHTQDVEEIEEDDGFEDLGRRDDEVKRRGNSVDDENLKLAGLAGVSKELMRTLHGRKQSENEMPT